MMAELRRQLAEQEDLIKKSENYDDLQTIAYNAVGYMMEQGLSEKEIEEYLGTSIEVLKELEVLD